MSMPEYMRVRSHLYNLIAKADGKDLQIPPENELCRLFDVSRVTVRGAIKGMVKDKFLIPRRGVGTFMNPAMIGLGTVRMPVVGLLQGDGRHVTGAFAPDIAARVVESGMNFEILHLPDSGSPKRLVEIVKAGMDAVVWMNPEETSEDWKYVEALSGCGVPLLLIHTEKTSFPEGFDCVVCDRGRRGVAIADYLHALGHKDLLLVHNLVSDATLVEPGSTHFSCRKRMKELCRSSKPPHDRVCNLHEFKEMLRERADFLKSFSVVYSVNYWFPYIMDMLDEADVSVPEDVSLLSYGKSDPCLCRGLAPDHMDTESALRRALLEWLTSRVRMKGDAGEFRREIAMGIVKGETVKQREGTRP